MWAAESPQRNSTRAYTTVLTPMNARHRVLAACCDLLEMSTVAQCIDTYTKMVQ
jgi:hypothetical protein